MRIPLINHLSQPGCQSMLTCPKSRFSTGHSEGSLNDSDPQDAPGEILGGFWSAQTIPPLFEGKIIDFENIPQPNGWERFQFFGADAWENEFLGFRLKVCQTWGEDISSLALLLTPRISLDFTFLFG